MKVFCSVLFSGCFVLWGKLWSIRFGLFGFFYVSAFLKSEKLQGRGQFNKVYKGPKSSLLEKCYHAAILNERSVN